MAENTVEDDIPEEDYYAFLNVSKEATSDEITGAYRRLSKLYHPDRHTDPNLKQDAEHMFNKTKTAYEILNDPHQRAIYDTLGIKGLNTDGWQVIERTRTANEIREEYERLVKAKEELLRQQQTNAKGTINVFVNATDLFDDYDLGYRIPNIQIVEMSISQSVDAPLENNQTMTVHGNLRSQKGYGSGGVNCSVRKVCNAHTWVEGCIGAGNGLQCSLKASAQVSRFSLITASSNFRLNDSALSGGLELMMARTLSKTTSGYITLKRNNSTSVLTTIVHDTGKGHVSFGIQLGVTQSFLTWNYTRRLEDEAKLMLAFKVGVMGVMLEYGMEKKISKHSNASAAMIIGVPYGVTLKLKYRRSNQVFNFPIILSHEFVPSAVFYGTVTPIIGWFLFKTLYLEPYNKKQKQRELEKKKEANAQRLAEKRREASIAVSLMQETYRRIKLEEESKSGLIIKLAVYGSSDNIANVNIDQIDSQLELLDATVQMQCLVNNSRLILPDRSKSCLPGFFDPCIGEDKSLRVDYVYRNRDYSITIADNQMLRLPRVQT